MFFILAFLSVVACLNPIEIENHLEGTYSWLLTHPPNFPNKNYAFPEIEGYVSTTSVNIGNPISFYVSTTSPTYGMIIYRMGWYQGYGAREMLNLGSSFIGQNQPKPVVDEDGFVECNWELSYSFTIPFNWTSGVYLTKLTAAKGKQNYMIFIVRNDSHPSTYLMPAAVATWQGRNNWGGHSLQSNNSVNSRRASKVSFNRPYGWAIQNVDRNYTVGTGQFFGWEYNMIRWLEKNGYDVSYCSNLDFDENPQILLSHRAYLSVGHDEYFTSEMKHNLEFARDMGVHLGFFSARNIHWQVRFESSTYTFAPYRTLVSYQNEEDPLQNGISPSTGFFMNSNTFEAVGDGEADLVGSCSWTLDETPEDGWKPNVTITNTDHWVCRDTNLFNGDQLTPIIGPAYNQYLGIASYLQRAPQGVAEIAQTSWKEPSKSASGSSSFTIYTAKSGAKVLSSGTSSWSWALDEFTVTGINQTGRLDGRAEAITKTFLKRAIPNATGIGHVWMLSGSKYIQTSNFGWRSSWRHIIPGYFTKHSCRSDLFFYDASTNPLAEGSFYSISATGESSLLYRIPLKKSYKFIIPGKFVPSSVCESCTQLLLYDGIDGSFTIYIPNVKDHTAGHFVPLRFSSNPQSPNQPLGKVWDMIIPGHFSAGNSTDLLLYNKVAGEIWIYQNTNNGWMLFLSKLTNQSKTWHAIVPGKFSTTSPFTSLMFYDTVDGYVDNMHDVPQDIHVTGFTQFYTTDGHGNLTTLGTKNPGIRSTWRSIISGNFYPKTPNSLSHLMFYDATTGLVFYYYADGSGGLISLGTSLINAGGISNSYQVITALPNKANHDNLLAYDANPDTPI